MNARNVIALPSVLALAAAAAAAPAPSVTYIPADRVKAAFEQGVPLLEAANYKIHASRRDGPGQVEVHEKDTDVIHVLTGTATLVTGGTVVGAKATAVEEIRGTDVQGGETREIKAGDVIVVPNGTPHWFKAVPSPMTYYVVKVRAEGGK
ncbi:MAG TPA: cupin domain-containing protein [Vicinamibacteria bacterium]|nr:cupin domain-containing protein [Vicinamibacteria bacterium]